MTLAQHITRFIDFFYRPFSRWFSPELFRYAACGGGNLVFDWLLYAFLYNFVFPHEVLLFSIGSFSHHISPHIATLCVTYPITLFTGFWLAKYVTFTQSSLRSRTQAIRYVMVSVGNLAINYIGLKILVEMVGFWPSISKGLVTVICVLFSYLGQKYYTFRKQKK